MALAGHNVPGAGRDHIQLVLTDRSSITKGKDLGVYGARTWRLADLGSKHMLLREGIGWGYMPELKSGHTRLFAIYRTDTPPGPAGSWLISRFKEQAGLEHL